MRRLLRRGVHAATLALGGLALGSGCAVASKEPASPTADAAAMEAAPAAAGAPAPLPRPSPGDAFDPTEGLDPAANLARAEADLDAALGGPRTFATPPDDSKRAPGPKGAEAPKESPLAVTDACATACRALASMRRSADRICDLTTGGAEPARCEDARTRVTRAVERVRERCPTCTSEG